MHSMLRGGIDKNNGVVGILAKHSPRHFWGIRIKGITLRLHRRENGALPLSSTKILVRKKLFSGLDKWYIV